MLLSALRFVYDVQNKISVPPLARSLSPGSCEWFGVRLSLRQFTCLPVLIWMRRKNQVRVWFPVVKKSADPKSGEKKKKKKKHRQQQHKQTKQTWGGKDKKWRWKSRGRMVAFAYNHDSCYSPQLARLEGQRRRKWGKEAYLLVNCWRLVLQFSNWTFSPQNPLANIHRYGLSLLPQSFAIAEPSFRCLTGLWMAHASSGMTLQNQSCYTILPRVDETNLVIAIMFRAGVKMICWVQKDPAVSMYCWCSTVCAIIEWIPDLCHGQSIPIRPMLFLKQNRLTAFLQADS